MNKTHKIKNIVHECELSLSCWLDGDDIKGDFELVDAGWIVVDSLFSFDSNDNFLPLSSESPSG